ncbi:MAG: RNA methyltransferase [Xanthomonadaceae bacterium]|nr:RNA methyltransferase [Xanthomonadaceae bacterium]
MLFLKNPHSVLATLQKRPKDVTEINLSTHPSAAWIQVEELARSHRIPINHDGKRKSPQQRGDQAGRESSSEAVVKERESLNLEKLLQGKGLWLALDCLQDPQNIGSIFRTASFFGLNGIILTQERSAPLSSVAYDIASGGLESVPFCIQPNLQQAFQLAKDKGLWILGSSEHAKASYRTIEKDRNWLLVLGNEEKGMRRLTEENCDVTCTIPNQGAVTSLNVATAASILIAHLT